MKKFKKNLRYFLSFWLIFLFPLHHFSSGKLNQLIIWNVGQGQMLTYSTISSCIHFDMGGEFFSLKKLVQECAQKENKVFFSHWDWDHINFTKKIWRRMPDFCRLNSPGGKGTKQKKKFLYTVPLCTSESQKKASKIFREINFPAHWNKSNKSTDSNKHSRVVILKSSVLIPADSPDSSEPLWWGKIKDPIHTLIVSHHGSRYATTPNLLLRLPQLKLAIASARRKRYGHPHPLVKKRLKKKGVPLLSTEEFNNIRIPVD